MIKVKLGNKRVMIPAKWEECQQRHLLAYCYAIHARREQLFTWDKETGKRVPSNPLEFTAAQLGLLQALLGVNHFQLKRISSAQLRDLLSEEKLLDFFFTTLYHTNHVESITAGISCLTGKKLHGPINGFHNLTFAEWGMAEHAYRLFNTTNDDRYLAELAGVLYRPRSDGSSGNDQRVPFEIPKTDAYVSKIYRYVQNDTLMLIHLWFDHCYIQLQYNFPKVFSKNDPPKAMPGEEKPGSNWVDIALSLTDAANFQAIAGLPVYIVFKQMERNIAESERLKAQAKK